MVNGRLVIEVRGTVQDLGAGENVYAFAGKQAGLPPWYPGGPAAISGGLWTAEITGLPASGGDFSVWAGVASPPPPLVGCQAVPGPSGTPQPCPPPSPGPSAAIEAQKHELAVAGPHALVLRRVSRPRHVVLPPG
jgi:hypothetical protein